MNTISHVVTETLGESPWAKGAREGLILFGIVGMCLLGARLMPETYEAVAVGLFLLSVFALCVAVSVSVAIIYRILKCFRGYAVIARGLADGSMTADFAFNPDAVNTQWLIVDLNRKVVHINQFEWPLINLRMVNKFDFGEHDTYIEFSFTGEGIPIRLSVDSDLRDEEFNRLLDFLQANCNWKSVGVGTNCPPASD
ncbi:hypothetical protein OAN24_03860 [Pseudodesulfovibrio sp.]|nr:hypothetical protein [Pseudodesulfovibrio sp.]